MAVLVIAISFGWLIGGIIVIENVFNYPGLGRLLLFAIDRRDVPLMQALAIVVVLGVVFANLIADLLYPQPIRGSGTGSARRHPLARYSAISRMPERVEEPLQNARNKVQHRTR